MIISVTNLKGGVGKSTISRNLAVYFNDRVDKVCIIDTDLEQRTTCDWLERRGEDVPHIPVFPMTTVEALPKDVKTHRSNGYDIIIIDGVPQLDQVAVKTILLSDVLLIPITPSIDDLKSFQRFVKVYEQAKVFREQIPAYIVLNKYSDRVGEDKEVREALEMFEEFGIKKVNATIGDRVAHRRSSKYGLTAYEWEDKKAKKEIENLGEELEEIITILVS